MRNHAQAEPRFLFSRGETVTITKLLTQRALNSWIQYVTSISAVMATLISYTLLEHAVTAEKLKKNVILLAHCAISAFLELARKSANCFRSAIFVFNDYRTYAFVFFFFN
jgi:hypothetical protein